MSETRRKIGLMGGTFDPIHVGHLILGEAAWRQYGLDEVWFMPAGNPRHKQNRVGRATDDERVNMVSLAIQSNPHFSLSLIEMNPDGYTYTYRTLDTLRKMHPDVDWYFIMGADSLKDFDTWMEPEKIVSSCQIVVATRNHMEPAEFDALLQKRREQFHHDFLKLDTPNLDVSSRNLREMLQAGESIRYYVPDNVLYYIRMKNIYIHSGETGENADIASLSEADTGTDRRETADASSILDTNAESDLRTGEEAE